VNLEGDAFAHCEIAHRLNEQSCRAQVLSGRIHALAGRQLVDNADAGGENPAGASSFLGHRL
jgi:hypothetical protein